MKKLPFLFCLFCGFGASAQTTVVDSIVHDGIYRNYRLYVPAIYSGAAPVPLILNLHGYTSNALEQQFYGNFMPIADTANFLVVHPNGTELAGSQFWNAGFTGGSPDDAGFLAALIDSLSAHYNIDPDRVYTTGMSNGGFMSYFLSCDVYDRFAAMGSVTGAMTVPMYTGCSPAGPMPVIEIHGTADGTVPYNGSSTSMHIDSVVKFWVQHNHTVASPVVYNYPNVSTTDGCTATEYAYAGGDMGSEVVLVKINGGGHTWPGAAFTVGVTNQDFSASIRIWEFFRKFRKSQFTGINEQPQQKNSVEIYPNPATDNIFIRGLKGGEQVEIFSAQGNRLQSHIAAGTGMQLNVQALPAGVYLLRTGTVTHTFIRQ